MRVNKTSDIEFPSEFLIVRADSFGYYGALHCAVIYLFANLKNVDIIAGTPVYVSHGLLIVLVFPAALLW